MNARNIFFSLAVVVPSLFGSDRAALDQESMHAPETPAYGIVVEYVGSKSEAERAGLQPGDILLNCTAGNDINGPVQSPFGFYQVEIELNAWGSVTLQGTRGQDKKVWTLNSTPSGLKVRPALSGDILALYDKGRLLADTGKTMEAAALWKSLAVKVEESPPTHELNSWLLFRAAELLAGARQWEQADAFYQEAVHQGERAEPAILSLMLQTWAATFQARSDWASAENYYERSINASHKAGTETTAAKSLASLSIIARNRGDLVKAEDYARASLSIRETLAPGSLWMAHGLHSIGIIRWMTGDYAGAEGYYSRAREIYQKLAPDSAFLANNLNNLGLVAWNRGDAARAEEYYLESLRIDQRLDSESLGVATAYLNLASVVRRRGEFARAEEYFLHALAIQEKRAPDSLDVALSLNGLAIVASARGDLVNAEKYCRRALDIQEKISPGSADVALSFANLAEVVRLGGDLAKAEEYYQRALQIQQKIATGNYDYGNTLNNLGSLAYARSNLDQAEEYYQRALAVFQKLAPGSMENAESLSGLASVAQRRGQMDTAAQFFERALEALESHTAHLGGSKEDEIGFRAQHSDYYLRYIDVLMTQKRAGLAFQVLERWHARSLLELLAEARVDIGKGADPLLLQQKRALKEKLAAKSNRQIQLSNGKNNEEQVAAINKEIEELLGQLHQIEGQLRASSSAYAALSQPEHTSLKDVQKQLLDKDTLLIEYALGEERSYVWVAGQNSLESYQLPKRAEIEAVARRFYESLTARGHRLKGETSTRRHMRLEKASAERRQAAVVLSKMVLSPVATRLGDKRLLIVSDGALQYIPFAALPEPYPTPGGKISQPLIVHHEIVNLPSASVLAMLRQHTAGRKPPTHVVAILADPVFNEEDSRVAGEPAARTTNQPPISGPGTEATLSSVVRSANDIGVSRFGRLPFSRQEASAILSLTPAGEGMEALDFQANRSTATSQDLAQYRIVHFATHGLLNSKHPELSGLVLSLVDQKGKPQNGFLGLQEIYNLDLPAELVVLSACETGLGKEIRGEGLVGLTRGFMYAGATRVAASLWSIDDAATAELMRRFYEAMLQDGLPPAAALRRSQVQMWRQERFADPYYWASFTIQGEWKGTVFQPRSAARSTGKPDAVQ